MKDWSCFVRKPDEKEVEEIERLKKRLHQQKSIYFKMDPGILTSNEKGLVHIIYKEQGRVIGYLLGSSFDKKEMEFIALVERKEIFQEMYDLAIESAAKQGIMKALFIGDRNDVELASLIKNNGFAYSFTEFRMNLDTEKFKPMKACQIVLRDATIDDRQDIARLDEVFDMIGPIEMVAQDIASTKIAMLHSNLIGKIRLDDRNNVFGIYGFVVDHNWRGQGLGREILSATIEGVLKKNPKKIYLEVESNNTPAFKLYESLGFVSEVSFDYYECNI